MSEKQSTSRELAHIEQRVVAAFRNAATRVPAYQRLLAERGIMPGDIRSIADFSTRVPLTDKESTFATNEISDLCVRGTMSVATAAYTSSGYSKTFSFGVETAAEADGLRTRVDAMLAHHFGADRRRTMVVNALPMGVRVPAGIAMVVDTGLRADAVLAAVRKFGSQFEQVVIVGEHPFLKKVLEDGADAGIGWQRYTVHLVTGAEVMPEHFRQYAAGILGQGTPGKAGGRGMIVVSFGISEIGLSVGQETAICRQLRGLAASDENIRRTVFGEAPFVPTFVQWNPNDYWLESVVGSDGKPRLVVTTLDVSRSIPLIRYATGDWARTAWPEEIAAAARSAGADVGEMDLPLPFVMVWGRGRSVDVGGKAVYPEQVKDLVYGDARMAGVVTGYFRMREELGELRIEFQLKPDRLIPEHVQVEFTTWIGQRIGFPLRLEFIPYRAFEFGLELSYQRKFQYL